MIDFSTADRIVTPSGEVQSIHRGSELVWERTLPADYEELEYVQAANSQYFFVNSVHLTSESEVEADLRFSGSAGNTYGCYTSGSATDNFCFYGGSTSTNGYIRYDGELKRAFTPPANTRMTITQNKTGFYRDGTAITTFSSATFTCQNPFGVGQLSGSSSAKFSGRIYGIVAREGGSELLHLIPAQKVSTSEVGMYDTVGKTFYVSQSATPFVAGPAKYAT